MLTKDPLQWVQDPSESRRHTLVHSAASLAAPEIGAFIWACRGTRAAGGGPVSPE